jgi:hypothetical protein
MRWTIASVALRLDVRETISTSERFYPLPWTCGVLWLVAPADYGKKSWSTRGLILASEINMLEYILLMHDDADTDDVGWEPYIQKLCKMDFSSEGGSAIGDGICARKRGTPAPVTAHLCRYIRVRADSLDRAKTLLDGNPHFEAGGTVEIRELPRTE